MTPGRFLFWMSVAVAAIFALTWLLTLPEVPQ